MTIVHDSILVETVERILQRPAIDDGGPWAAQSWKLLVELGIAGIGLAEDRGGSGGSFADAASVVGALAAGAVSVPVAETGMIASRLLEGSGLQVEGFPLTVALFKGRTAKEVPFGRAAACVLALKVDEGEKPEMGMLRRGDYVVEERTNLAGEPRDTLVLERQVRFLPGDDELEWRLNEAGAIARAVQIAACASTILELTVRYVSQREQFGKPVILFQAVQQQLARLAGEVFLAGAAADAAVEFPTARSAAMAKAVCSQAATFIANTAHQLHGAIGFTDDYELSRFTKRLWSWRDEYGTERFWGERLGQLIPVHDRDTLWDTIVSVGTM